MIYNIARMNDLFDTNRLSVRLVGSFLLLVLMTALAVGLPAIWLIKGQLDQQAWSQIEQGEKTAVSLYEKRYLELKNDAILTAQRPTLNSLLEAGDLSALREYLITLQGGANLDLIDICQSQHSNIGTHPVFSACGYPAEGRFIMADIANYEQAWMIARSPLEGADSQVMVGQALDDSFATEISDQIGLEFILVYAGNPVSSSFNSASNPQDLPPDCIAAIINGEEARSTCTIGEAAYYTSSSQLIEKGLSLVVAMDISRISLAEKRLMLSISAAILIVSALGASLGIYISRRVSRPLENLSRTAGAFSQGDLETPFMTKSKVVEITRVTRALDRARLDLRNTLQSLEAEKDWSENLLASIVEAIITLDKEGRITYFSHGAERLTGLFASEADGTHIDEVLTLADGSSFERELSAAPDRLQKVDLILPDSRALTCSITSAQLNRVGSPDDGEKALVIRDISEEEAVHRLLGQFIANVAHELRTPLTALEASIEMLHFQTAELTEDEKGELYNSLYLGILGLHTLVDNLLESANIEARHFRISPRRMEVEPIIVEAVQTMQPLLTKYEQRLTVELPLELPPVKVDPRRTAQVLVNLISNANRHGPPGEEIILQVSVSRRFVKLSVKDRGPGISAEHRDSLFRRFEFPHDDHSRSQAGAGLGLSVVKEIVLAHGGDVGLEDHPGGGSVFWFTIPIDEELA